MKPANARFLRNLIYAAALIAGMAATAAADDAPVRFVSPLAGQVVRSGETIAIILEVDPALGATWAYVSGPIDETELVESPEGFKEMIGPPFETTFTIARDFTGPTVLFGRAFLAERSGHIRGAEVALMVVPADPPIRIVTSRMRCISDSIPLHRIQNA